MSYVNQRIEELQNQLSAIQFELNYYQSLQVVEECEKMTFDYSDEWWQNICLYYERLGIQNDEIKNGNLIFSNCKYGFIGRDKANDLRKLKATVKTLKERSNMTDYTWVKQLTKAIKDIHAYRNR